MPILIDTNAKEYKRFERNLKKRTFGLKTDRRKVVSRATSATLAAKNMLNTKDF